MDATLSLGIHALAVLCADVNDNLNWVAEGGKK